MRLWPRTLFGRNAAGLLLVFALVQGAAFAGVWVGVIRPLLERSADDQAARIVLAAQTWVELPPQTRTDYEMELSFRHGLELGVARTPLRGPLASTLQADLLRTALSRRVGQSIRVHPGSDGSAYWLDLPAGGQRLRIGVAEGPAALGAPLALAGVFALGAALTVLAALLMARHTSQRLAQLAAMAREVGQGRSALALPESGARELAELTAAFNRMAREVRALLENRTVLLAGLSHDLRTPITRLRLALALLEDRAPERVAGMVADLDHMNRLIGDMLAFARALHPEADAGAARACDLGALLRELAAQASAQGPVTVTGAEASCARVVAVEALRRVLGNLLDNARRYGGGGADENPGDQPGDKPGDKPGAGEITLALVCAPQETRIGVLDRGPGIPEAQREAVFTPFYRLETSRNTQSGGSGLGLAIVRQLADAQGWRVALEAREGGGLAAWVVLPADGRVQASV